MKTVYFLALLVIIGCLVVQQAAGLCICTADYSPVCATNGETYTNSCNMECAGAQFSHDGPC